MGLVANVGRRGGVYWWRGRISPQQQPSRLVARSLRTRDPEIARALGTHVTGLAAQLRQRVKCGTMTFDQAKGEIDAFLAEMPFVFDPKALDRLERVSRRPAGDAPLPDLAYSVDQEAVMLADFTRRMGLIIERCANEVRNRPPLVLDGVAADWVAEAIRAHRIQAEVCHLLATSGTSARVRPDDREALAGSGFSADEIDEVDELARQHAMREGGSDWRTGPERDVLLFHLQAVGAVPTAENVRRLRRATLFVLAHLLRDNARDYCSAPAPRAIGLNGAFPRDASTLDGTPGPTRSQPVAAPCSDPAVGTAGEGQAPVATVPGGVSFLAMVDRLIRGKTQGKSREWDDKTGRQHRSVAKLFVKVAKTDDPALMTQRDVGAYLALLRIIPTHHGKSAADDDRCIEEILARSDDLDEDEIGLAPPTINRHRGQLGTILKYLKENGFTIGVIDESSRAKDNKAPGEKRQAFTAEDGERLMTTLDERSLADGLADPDALLWVPLLAWYELTRLSEAAGLAPDDVDLAEGMIHIRSNGLRRLKTASSARSLPIHPELERLGFRRFVASAQASGSKALFPKLFERKSSFPVVFQKMWAPVLDVALPTARQNRKTLHSTRKMGNTAMHNLVVKDNTRLHILGHAKIDVNGRHYLAPPSRVEMLEALSHVPVVTSLLKPRFGA